MQYRYIPPCIICLAFIAFPGSASPATLDKADREFVVMAAKTDMTEAHEGQMAEKQATRDDVKSFAKTLVDDHTKSYAQLCDLGGKIGVDIPKGIDTAKDRTISQLVHLKGNGFDRQFINDQIAGHRRDLAIFKREAEHAQNPEVKAYAAEMVPVLEKHLNMAQECAKSKHASATLRNRPNNPASAMASNRPLR